MRRLVIENISWVPLRDLLKIVYTMTALMGLGIGIGMISILPWFLRQEAAIGERNRISLDRCRAETGEIRQAINEIAGKVMR